MIRTAFLLLFLCNAHLAFSQGSTQVIITGIPPMLPSPYVSDLENNYHQGRYQMQLIFANNNPDPVEFVYDVYLTKDGKEILSMTSEPVSYTPGTYYYSTFKEHPRVSFSADPLDQISGDIYDKVIREGILPEGSYMIEIEVRPLDGFDMITSIPGFAYFEVRFPQPPLLVSPMDEGFSPPNYSVFSWTPVLAFPGYQFEYEILIVEILPHQTPYQAITANREVVLETTSHPLFIHTHEHLPLEVGNEYAWMVTASEIHGRIPVSDDGKSEIFTFTAGDMFADIDFDDLKSIQLVPDFAEVINLENLTAEFNTATGTFTLDGLATLRLYLEGAGLGTVDINIHCFDLEIQISGFDQAIATGGEIQGSIAAEILPLDGVTEIIDLESIHWNIFDGITVEAGIIDPTGDLLEASGLLNLSPAGLYGSITATGPAGDPLLKLGVSPLELLVNEVSAYFPGAYLTMDANLRFFQEASACQISEVLITGSPATFIFSCDIGENIPLMPGVDLATLFLQSASGEINFSWGEDAGLDFALDAGGSIHLKALHGNVYEIPMMASLSSEQGALFQVWLPPIISNPPPIDLGLANLKIHRMQDPYLAYDHTINEWDFGIDFDAELVFPDFDELKLTGFAGLTLDRYGIHFPDYHFDEEALRWVPSLELAGFGAKLTAFTLPAFTFPWFDWDGMMPGPWDFSFDFELTTPNFGNYLPSCLRNLSLSIHEASFSGGSFAANLPPTAFGEGECHFTLGAGYELSIQELGGGIFGEMHGGNFSLDGFLQADASMIMGTPFDCDDTSVELSAENLKLMGNGVFEGEFTNIIPACPLKIGPYTAGIQESVLSFSGNQNSQQAGFDATAYLEFPTQDGGMNQIQGEVGIDLMSGEFHTLYFHIDEPFVWLIPNEDEVLRFNIEEAVISEEGLFINGQQEFIAGETTINVSFNELLLDLFNFQVISGSIDFDSGFAFEAGINPADFSLAYQTLPLESGMSEHLDPGIYFELAGEVSIDKDGLHASGTADAEIKFATFSTGDLTVNFSDNFAFGLDPFQVVSGQIEVIYDGALVAIIDPYGFHPAFDFIDLEALIPDKLPLPSHSVAYLFLKEEGELLVDIEQHPEHDFAAVINTKEGQEINFVFPVLQGDLSSPPVVGVEFSDLVVSLAPLKFESGEVQVSIPDGDDYFDLSRFGIPLSLKDIYYGNIEQDDLALDGLFFRGNLFLFEKELGEDASVAFRITTDGAMSGSVEMEDLNASIPLVPGSDLAVITIEEVSGYGSYNLLQPQIPPVFHFDLASNFLLQVNEDNYAGADISITYNQHGLLTDFNYQLSGQTPYFDLDPFIFRINEVHSLSLDYDKEDGFDFYAALDFEFGMKFEEDSLLIPLQGIEIRPGGFAIPAQEVHDGTTPPLQVPPIELLGFELQPLAFRTHDVVVDVFSFSPGDLSGLIPNLDFALSFPGLEEMAPNLEGISLTVLDAGFQNGRLTGSVEVHEPIQPITVPFGDNELDIERFAGTLSEIMEEGIPQQSIEIEIEGEIPPFHQFETEETCEPAAFAFSIVQGRGFKGNIQNFIPCGEIPIGKLGLSFLSSTLELDFIDNQQTATIDGSAQLSIPRKDEPTVNIQGDLVYDLVNGSLLEGTIEITDAFQWGFPADATDPFLLFNVQQARLDSAGFTLKADGSLEVMDNIQVNVSFDELLIGLSDLQIKGGEASISSGFAFDLMFLPVKWRMVPPTHEFPVDTNLVRMGMADIELKLDKNGLAFAGEGIAELRLPKIPNGQQDPDDPDDPDEPDDPDDPEDPEEEMIFENLRLVFEDDFRLNMPPTSKAKSGRSELWLDEGDESSLLLWYDTDGIGFGNLLDMFDVIPDTLGLPVYDNFNMAYMVLREDGDLRVSLERDAGQNTLRTVDENGVKIVIAGLTDEPSFRASFDITVNDAFEIISGSIAVDLENGDDVLDNNPIQIPDLPITLTSIKYERGEDDVGVLSAGALLKLPESLGDLNVVIDEVRLSEEGFEQASFSIGEPDFDHSAVPEYSKSFAEDAFVINIFYANVSFGEVNSFGINGTFQSNLFRDDDTEELSSLPFSSIYDHVQGRWDFSLDFDHNDPIEMSLARLAITQFDASATESEFALILSGVISIPDLLGDDFAVSIDSLFIGTAGIRVGAIDADFPQQEISFFQDKVQAIIDHLSPEYEDGVFYVTLDGELNVLGRDAQLNQMRVGSDGSIGFGADGGLSIGLLTTGFPVLPPTDYLLINQITFGMQEVEVDEETHTCFSLTIDGEAKLPAPVDTLAAIQVVVAQVGRDDLRVDFKGAHLELGEEQGIFKITEGIEFQLTEIMADIDFQDMDNTMLAANGKLLLENENGVKNEISFGNNISETPGFRYSIADGATWNATSTGTPDNPLFDYQKAFFEFTIFTAETYDPKVFGVKLDGKIGLDFTALSMNANFNDFKISSQGIESWGNFQNGGNITIMDKLSLEIGAFDFAPNGGVLNIMEVATDVSGSGDDIPDPEPTQLETQYHLLIENAQLTMVGNGESGMDNFGGGVKKFLFYRDLDENLLFQIDSANVALGDHATANLSMKYNSGEGGSYYLGASGRVTLFDDAALGMAGMVENTSEGDLRFGFFVNAEFPHPGIPLIIPGTISLTGIGGGFFYNPEPDDFQTIYNLAEMSFHDEYTPTFTHPHFAVFLQAGIGLIETGGNFYIDGKYFMEITNDGVVIHLDGYMMGQNQPGSLIQAIKFLEVNWGDDDPYLQGGIQLGLDYGSALNGSGNVAFYLGAGPAGPLWAVWGGTEINFFILETNSGFIVCNDGMLVDFGMDFSIEKSGWYGTWAVAADVGASVWYIYEVPDFGAYGELWAMLSGPGFELEGELFGAYIYSEALFYAHGCGSYDVFLLGSGDACGYVSFYGEEGWDAGKGVRDDLKDIVEQAHQEAQDLLAATQAIQDDIDSAMEELEFAADVEQAIEDLQYYVETHYSIIYAKNNMESKVDYVNSIAPEVRSHFEGANLEMIDLLEETEMLAAQLENPIEFIEGNLSGEDLEDLQVAANPQINFAEAASNTNQVNLLEEKENIEAIMEHYEESIARAMNNLAQLEMLMEGTQNTTLDFTQQALDLFGLDLAQNFNQFGSGFHLPSGGHFFFPGGGNPQNPNNLSYLSENYTQAARSIESFYEKYMNFLWGRYFTSSPGSPMHVAADSLIDIYSDHFADVFHQLESQHASFTDAIDGMYTIKAQMITTIYGMIEIYAYMHDSLGEDGESDLIALQASLAQMLEPPVISSFTINPSNLAYSGYMNVYWSTIWSSEISYSFAEDGIGPFLSAGGVPNLFFSVFKTSEEELERSFNIGLRARSEGGNTSIQMTNFTVAVDPDGNHSAGGDQLPDDVPEPSTPVVAFPYESKLIATFPPYLEFYTSNPNRLDFSITAYAEGSDIASFEYALGTTQGGTDVLDWTEAVGVIEPVDIGEGGITRKINTSIFNLSLEHNTTYFISVRAYNTQGSYGENFPRARVIFDATPPSAPASVELAEVPDGQSGGGSPTVYPQVAGPPDWEPGKYNEPQGYIQPSVTLQWSPGEDPESGISCYEYVLSTIADPESAFQQAANIGNTGENQVTISGPPVSYSDPLYFHIRSRNKAGLVSENIITVEAVKAKDITPPSKPVANVRLFGNALRLHLPLLSVDAESQVQGYQYSVGTSPGNTSIKNWGSAIDFEQNIQLLVSGQIGHPIFSIEPEPIQVPQHNIPVAGLPSNTNLFVNVRAVNGEGLTSGVVSSGPFKLGTYPDEPVVNLDYDSDSGNLQIEIQNIYDEGAAIQNVSYRVKVNDTGNYMQLMNIQGIKGYYPQPVNHPVINHWVPESESGYQVTVTVTNTGMKSTTVTEDYNHPVTIIPPPQWDPILPPSFPPIGW